MIENNLCGFLWAPCSEYYNDILEEINRKYSVFNYYIYKYNNRKDFEDIVLEIYSTDDIDPNKVKNIKLKSIKDNNFIYFTFYIKNPTFRKKGNGNDICVDIEKIKKEIRDKYKSKINNYVHDIIIHMCDNFEQNKKIKYIMLKYNYIEEYINVKYLIYCNCENNVFKRVDMLVRKYSIEQYMKNNDYNFSLYLKMQKLRIGENNGKNTHIKFKNLINELKNVDINIPIEYENKYMLRNGSHRLAIYYYKDKQFIKCSKLINYKSEGSKICNYDLDWFKNKFSNSELNIIENEISKLKVYMIKFFS